jgi:hypothetical protein
MATCTTTGEPKVGVLHVASPEEVQGQQHYKVHLVALGFS